jgi:hypothetical protein
MGDSHDLMWCNHRRWDRVVGALIGRRRSDLPAAAFAFVPDECLLRYDLSLARFAEPELSVSLGGSRQKLNHPKDKARPAHEGERADGLSAEVLLLPDQSPQCVAERHVGRIVCREVAEQEVGGPSDHGQTEEQSARSNLSRRDNRVVLRRGLGSC